MTGLANSEVRPDRTTLLAFMGVVLFGGINVIGVRQTVVELAPFWGASVRFVAAGLIMAAIVIATRRAFPRGRSLTGAVLYGAVGFAGSYGFVYLGLRDAPAGTAMVIIALAPLMTFGLAIIHGQERFRAQGMLGALISLTGVAIVFADQVSANVPVGSLLFIVLGVACMAEAGVIGKGIPRSDPFGTNAIAMLTGAGILVGLSLLTAEPWTLPSQTATWIAVGYLVVFGSVVMFALYLFALARWTASAVSYIALLMPLVTIPLAAVLTGERISPSLIAGGAVVLAGVYVGAFLKIQRPRVATTGLPECIPCEAGQAAAPAGALSRSG